MNERREKILIGISGKALVGKDTAADVLVKDFGFRKFAFADTLKRLAIKHFGITHEEAYLKKTECSWKIMQGLGTVMREQVDVNYWVNLTMKEISECWEQDPYQSIVVSDMRYETELYAILRAGGQVMRIERPNRPQIEYGSEHPSETQLDLYTKWHSVIINDTTLKAFQERVVMEAVINRWI
jgi:hypothetical protein